MGLVDYSDSESDSEAVAKPAPSSQPIAASAPGAAASGKKPFQKVVDRAKPGKILVNLPQSSSSRDESKPADTSNEPPPKRARVAGRGGGAFSGFNSILPPPKNVGKPAPAATASSSGKPAPRPGINLKTGAAPGFSREVDGNAEGGSNEVQTGREDAEPAAKQPSIPAEQKPAEEVKLVGKPLMFKPLSVSRKPGKKNATKPKTTTIINTTTTSTPPTSHPSEEPQSKDTEKAEPPPKRQKISLFSISDEQDTDPVETSTSNNTGVYEPMFSTSTNTTADDFAAYDAQFAASHLTPPSVPAPSSSSSADTLDAIAADMNLSAAARRELFGRGGEPSGSNSRVVRFDTDREYAHNEALRASGQLQPTYNPVRSLAPGKHSLRQLVTQVQSQREALEESFAKGHGNRKEASSKYGWR
ncbi:mitotic checkpoint regulator, MAD2B-interacting-domain-containing protein [Daldinia bambusicola]|nr:mitotic checkpoint regulator, MAD2B-interacting-domain-containing protein [Daldinia bambusicola]